MEFAAVRRQWRTIHQPGQRPAGAGELGAGRGRPCRGVRLHHQGGAAVGRPGRAVAAQGWQRQSPRHDRLAAGESGHLRRQPRHRLHPELMAFPLRQGHARLRLHPHAPRNSLHLLRPRFRLEPEARDQRSFYSEVKKRDPPREQAGHPCR
ncbi:hypothetical protein PVAP13_2NG343503 [Panicum virgatum]|uniref:Uncharacterized protein n=1 Tax=Panicum virgatum TaxID=38727 RepID=A0A8T0VEX5_PANVG|nr:hypothetical protein PVAP13_2NG343503 [Panicum virgatum]